MNGDEPRSVARSVIDHPYRRVLLALFDTTEPPVSVRELARGVLAYERGGLDRIDGPDHADGPPGPDTVGEQRAESTANVETMAAQLHHVHLPLLDAAGVIQYDPAITEVVQWRHPNVGDRWITAPPMDSLVELLRTADSGTRQASHHTSDESSVSH